MGSGLHIRCRVSRGASFDLLESTAKAVICDAKASKVRFEEFSLSRKPGRHQEGRFYLRREARQKG